jgi:hypothetical protein
MHHATGTAHRLRQAARIEKIAMDKGEFRMAACRGEKFWHPGAKIVITHNYVAIAQQSVDQITTDKSCCACYKGGQADTAFVQSWERVFNVCASGPLRPASERKACRNSVIIEHFHGV